jgi:hypothetical protein
MIFSSVVLVDKWHLAPWEISMTVWPFGLVNIISNLTFAPKLILSKDGPQRIVRYVFLFTAILELAKINWTRAPFDMYLLVKTMFLYGFFGVIAALHMPTLSMLLPRAIVKYGSSHIIGTVRTN